MSRSGACRPFEAATIRKISWRIIPFVFLLYVVNYIDRANISYAALAMNADLGLSSQMFGLAAGLFFVGYFAFEVPSNMALARFGARRWIARILLSWGILAVLLGFVHSSWQLYLLRFLLGVAEAGFFPGVIVYLARWFRSRELATTIALFTASIPVSYIIASPLSTTIIQHVDWFGLAGWRWMFVLEGVPAVLMGVVCYLVLTERPQEARWLTEQERDWIVAELAAEHAGRPGARHLSAVRTLRDPKVLYLGAIYFVYQVGSLGVGYWLPQIIKGFSRSLSPVQVGLIGMIPYAVATVAMVLWSRDSDRTGERKAHSWVPLGLAGVTMLWSGLIHSPVLSIVAISLALAGLYSFKAPFWAVPGQFLSVTTAGTAIASINSIGNLGGFVGPYALGLLKDATGGTSAGLIFLAVLLFVATAMMVGVRLTRADRAQRGSATGSGEPIRG